MQIEKIRELVAALEITTPSVMGRELRWSDKACRIELRSWWLVEIEKQHLFVKDHEFGWDLYEMVRDGLLTNITKFRYDNNTYRQAAIEELEKNYDKFMVGKRPFYVLRDEN